MARRGDSSNSIISLLSLPTCNTRKQAWSAKLRTKATMTTTSILKLRLILQSGTCATSWMRMSFTSKHVSKKETLYREEQQVLQSSLRATTAKASFLRRRYVRQYIRNNNSLFPLFPFCTQRRLAEEARIMRHCLVATSHQLKSHDEARCVWRSGEVEARWVFAVGVRHCAACSESRELLVFEVLELIQSFSNRKNTHLLPQQPTGTGAHLQKLHKKYLKIKLLTYQKSLLRHSFSSIAPIVSIAFLTEQTKAIPRRSAGSSV